MLEQWGRTSFMLLYAIPRQHPRASTTAPHSQARGRPRHMLHGFAHRSGGDPKPIVARAGARESALVEAGRGVTISKNLRRLSRGLISRTVVANFSLPMRLLAWHHRKVS